MGTWLKTTESPFTREMCSMATTKRIESSSLCWTAGKGLSALLTYVGERETWGELGSDCQKRDDAYRLFPGFRL